MIVELIVVMCLENGPCIERTVTDQASLMQCGATAAQAIPEWMEKEGYLARGYRLAKWGCAIGGRRRVTT